MKNSNKDILYIAYKGGNYWIHPIINNIPNEYKKTYKNSDLSSLGLAISTKIDIVRLITKLLSELHLDITNLLKNDISNIDDHILNGYAYKLTKKDEQSVFLEIGYIEIIIYEISAIVDLIIKYISNICILICKKKLKRREIIDGCIDLGLTEDWYKNLKNIRNDFTHNTTGWIAYKKINNSFSPMIELFQIKDGEQNFSCEFFDLIDFNEIINGYDTLLDVSRKFIIEQLTNL